MRRKGRNRCPRYVSGVVSVAGHVRARNEDAYACPSPGPRDADRGHVYTLPRTCDAIFLVADGVGGSEEGQRASLLAASTVVTHYYAADAISGPDRLAQAVIAANRAVLAYAESTEVTASTTLTALLIAGRRGIIAQVGDSRLYRVRAGAMAQLTEDHALIGESVRSGAMTAQEAAVSDLGNVITRSLGRDARAMPDISEIALTPEDVFVLCSDGLTRHVHEDEILHAVATTGDPQRAAADLATLALQRGGKDNVTVMVVRRKRGMRSSLIFTIIQVLALAVLLAGLIWSAYVAVQRMQGVDVGGTVSTIATPRVP